MSPTVDEVEVFAELGGESIVWVITGDGSLRDRVDSPPFYGLG